MQIKTVFIVFMATLVSAAAVPGGTMALEARNMGGDKNKGGNVKAAADDKNKGGDANGQGGDDKNKGGDANGQGGNGNGNGNGGVLGKNGANFGKCKPTMDFQTGRPGRKATEGTFLPTDPLVSKGQGDALNPGIITNAICNQLTNVCNANPEAKKQCAAAKAMTDALGTKDASTAAAFNKALGF
ncbi:hypothetical protein MGG_12551 [Pyricularia oryzae 70-15]|uniref:Uncharacterized protein n=3 Tax=Pyricularia oryzae TaxID=318829 RepID=G4NLB6_PYRO7|nr:uncharacterized protein MGG_12551 [Pyricularia oryzae 70-15]EHA46000.1 hypothetical protein MGG_12551 [Pyricularia oryzae 70-15]ELQ42648.1 hypothetical protein OOU_Y34scaffold00199g6 [Pyricularia oryzae Y34]KAI7915778.1 hypothetical protein M0657_008893 [Pyricularia oryzae]KAI7917806.1 hypothetical protein M9X92_007225 [Pyricularia oryzae]